MLEAQDHTLLLHNNLLEEKLKWEDRDLEKWKSGHLNHTVLATHYRKCLQSNPTMSWVVRKHLRLSLRESRFQSPLFLSHSRFWYANLTRLDLQLILKG